MFCFRRRCNKYLLIVIVVVSLLAWYAPHKTSNRVFSLMQEFGSDQMLQLPAKFQNIMQTRSLFSRMLSKFDWNAFIEAIIHEKTSEIDALQENLIHILKDLVILEPKVPINADCSPPSMKPATEDTCSSLTLGNAFTGTVQENPPKIGILIQFGFSVDVLEIYLNEVYDLVDRFFILESTRTHMRALRKDLIWGEVKHQPRFAKFGEKIVHFIVDDVGSSSVIRNLSSSSRNDSRSTWNMELLQEEIRWTKFLAWNQEHQFFKENDLLGFGDADEIPSRYTLHLLKNCELSFPVVDVGIWFAFGNIKTAFESDFPIFGHRYTLASPTFFTLQKAKEYAIIEKYPTRTRGLSNNFVLGGIHMTFSTYLPFNLMRDFTCTECSAYLNRSYIENIKARVEADELLEFEAEVRAIPFENHASRLFSLDEMEEELRGKGVLTLPWFYACNRERYPTWEGKHDTRLD